MTNILVAGIGGQGIDSLARVVAMTCRDAGRACQYAVHKGGAQTLGSVYAELRVADNALLPIVGPSIPQGKLDLLVALDPWEGLRHLSLAHHGTVCYVETEVMPLFTDRRRPTPTGASPAERFAAVPLPLIWRSYRQTALDRTGTAKMANYFAGCDALRGLGLDNLDDYRQRFATVIPKSIREFSHDTE